MAIFHAHAVTCPCGTRFTAHLADSINIRRAPAMRGRILRGELHRAACPGCRREMTVEKAFYYTDLDRKALFKVLPRGERHTWKHASRTLSRAAEFVRAGLPEDAPATLRVVFGMDELREKLVAQDLGLDDRDVEVMKILLVSDHPILLRRPRLRLILRGAAGEDLVFGAGYEHDAKRFELRFPRALLGEITESTRLRPWMDRVKAPMSSPADHWVNLWRSSPQPSALAALRDYAQRLDAGQRIDPASAAFARMLAGLPRGSHLPSWAKRDLQKVFGFVRANGPARLEDTLFEIRFGIELESDWSVNRDNTDIEMLWNILRDLPDANVEGNTKIHEILLDRGGGGTYEYGTNDIAIGAGELKDPEGFEDVVRHEVGHAVHEKHQALVEKWLRERFGWRTFEMTDDGIDAWVALMGGWGEMSAGRRSECRTALRLALGAGSRWKPGPTPRMAADHPWNAPQFGPRLAFEKTGADWYEHFREWHRVGERAFFLNYWYQTLVAVDAATLDFIEAMPSNYAAMSHYEFFAELYALYHDLDGDRRARIPADVMAWLARHLGEPARSPEPQIA